MGSLDRPSSPLVPRDLIHAIVTDAQLRGRWGFLSSAAPTLDRVILTATIRTRPETGAKNVDGLEMDVITATADDYDVAKAELEARVPEGWQMLSIRRN